MKSLVLFTAILLAAPAYAGASKVLPHEPPEGALRSGKRVLVDDGSCPQGQILQVIGGHRVLRISRQRVCIPRG